MFKAWKRKRRKRKLNKMMGQMLELLRKIDRLMMADGWKRQERRRLWREFMRSPGSREKILESLTGAMK